MSAPVLVIGVGNRMRGDDAVGVLVADALRGDPTLRVRVCAADIAGLVDDWSDEAAVIVVDGACSGRAPGTVFVLDARADPLPAATFPSTHSFGLAEAVELSRALDCLPTRLDVVAIEVGAVALGAQASRALEQGVRDACEAVRALARGDSWERAARRNATESSR